MDSARWEKIDKLVDAALELPEEERADFVRSESGEDPDLADEVIALLNAQGESDTFLEVSAIGIAARNFADLNPDSLRQSYEGMTISGYSVERLIGTGGMGEVYLAYDPKLKRNIALKILSASYGEASEAAKRFRLEASAISSLNHPGIVTIYDFGEADEVNFIATEYVEGRTLRQMIGKPADLAEQLEIFIQICKALAAAHGAGIIHRDIKPENLMVRQDGFVKILDFGLVKLTGASIAPVLEQSGTKAGIVVGTPAYMSPSQISDDELDHRTDLWSCGVVLYEWITGRNPFKRDTKRQTFMAIAGEDVPPPGESVPGIPPELDAVLLRALAKDPAKGYQSAEEMGSDLESVRNDIELERSGKAFAAAQLSRSRQYVLPLFLFLVILAGSAAALIYYYSGNSPDEVGGVDWTTARSLQLTFESGTEVFPSMSPDGTAFVYASDKDGDFDIYFRKLGQTEEINLTADSPATDTMPTFSPDGRRIAFRSERKPSGIYIMSSDGTDQKLISDTGYDPSWSPDGKRIVVGTQTQSVPSVRSPSKLVIIDVESGNRNEILDNFAHQPAWSPDGSRIAFWFTENRGKRIVSTIPADGGEPVDFAFESNTNWNPVWSPDGTNLYYASDRGGNTGFWHAKIDMKTGLPVGRHESVPTPAKFNRHASFSRDGKTMIYVQTVGRSNVMTAAFDDRRLETTDEPQWLTRGDFEISSPELLPDGTGYVARLVRETQDDIVRIDGRSGKLTDLTNDPAFDRYVRVSPDGRKLAFASDKTGSYQIWLMDADGKGRRQLTNTKEIASIPTWSPDGQYLSFDSSNEVFIVDVAANLLRGELKIARRLPKTDGGGFMRVWDWSPDGKALAGNFSYPDKPGLGIYLIESGSYIKLTDYNAIPRWLPDSRRIIFINEGRPYYADMSTGTVREFMPSFKGEFRNIGISRDGKLLYFTIVESESNIWLLDASVPDN